MRRWFRIVAVTIFALPAFTAAAEPQAAAVPPPQPPTTRVVVMPLGDSITAGSKSGYRKPLVKRLADAHRIEATTVGSQTDPDMPAGTQAHEGHGGWRIDQLNDNLLGHNPVDAGSHGGHWLKGGNGTGRGPMKPTVVTLMAGINDLNQMMTDPKAKSKDDPAFRPMADRSDEILKTLQDRLKAIVGTLDANLPEATILLGGCIPYNNGLLDDKVTGATPANRKRWAEQDGVPADQELGVNHWVILFNRWIRDVYVPELRKAGKRVHYVDLYARFILPDGTVRGWNDKEPQRSEGPAAYADFGLHPNPYGYALIAEAWAEAIAAHAGK